MSAVRLRFGPFSLREDDESVWDGDRRLALPPKTYALLLHLVRNPGRLITKDELLESVWPDTYVADGALKVRIRELRAALGDDADEPRFVETVHRRGYRFIAAVTADGAGERAVTGRTRAAHGGGADGAPHEAAIAATAAAGEFPAAALVGRRNELARLDAALSRARAGDRQIVFVSGEPGLGKTALVDGFATQLSPASLLLGRGQCLEHYGSGEAYLPVLEAMAGLARGARGASVADVLRRHAPTWLAQLPWLLSAADRAALRDEIQGATRARMQREVADALEALAAIAPVVLILEDLHWSDPSTLDVLSLLAHRRQAARLLVVCTYRPVDVILSDHPLKSLKQRLEQQHLASELRLPYLETDDVAEMLRRRLGASEVPPALAEVIAERSAGNPLFVISLVDHMVERGWLARGAAPVALRVAPSTIRAEVPEGLRRMIEQQIERYGEAEVGVLEAASAVGEEFGAEAVAAALDADPLRIEVACDAEARRGSFVRAVAATAAGDRSPSARYAFAHALYRDVLYARAPLARRTRMHRRLGAWLEANGASAAEVARHYLLAARSGCAAKAVEHAVRAAERASSLLAFSEAARHYETALEALALDAGSTERRRCELTIALGEAREQSGALGPARETFRDAADVARRHGEHDLLARAALGIGRGHHRVNEVDAELIELLEEALAKLDEGDGALRACMLARLSTALSPIVGTHARSDALSREALAMARRLDDDEALITVRQYLRWGFSGRNGAGEVRESAAELARLAGAAGPRTRGLQARLLRIADLHELGEMEEAGAELERLRRLAAEAEVPWFGWFVRRLDALRALHEGRFADAEAHAQSALAYGQRMDHPNVMPVFLTQMLTLWGLQGRFADLLPRVHDHLRQHPEAHATRSLLAFLLWLALDAEGARRELEVLADDDFACLPRDSTWLVCLAYLTEPVAGLGDRRRAAVLRPLLAPYADRVIGVGPGIVSMGHGARYLALLEATLGRWDEAAALNEVAREAHERMGALPWLAFTHLDRARLWLARPARGRAAATARDRAETALARARELAKRLGMAGLERQIEATASLDPRPPARALRRRSA